MRSAWQLTALAANCVTVWASEGLSSTPSGSSLYSDGASASDAPKVTPEEIVWVTEVSTSYTTVCPTTATITNGDIASTTTYLDTSIYETTISTSTLTKIVSQISDGQVQAPRPTTTLLPSIASEASTSNLISVTTSVPSSGVSVTVSYTSSAEVPVNTQVGNSTWGTLDHGCYPKWLPQADGTAYEHAPWGNLTTKNSDATVEGDIPNTGVTRHYEFTISRGTIAPDGVLRDVILVNGQYPGPLVEANWGDWLNITVHNEIYEPFEGTSLHWHGMLQRGTPWYDGVPAVGQCPIAPGHSFTYVYQAELYGTSWYHTHYSAQYTAGALGPMIIYGPTQEDYDCDIGPIMLSDWYHIPYFSIVADAVGTDLSVIPPTSDSNLIQGRNSFNCSLKSYDSGTFYLGSHINSSISSFQCEDNAPLSQFRFKAGKRHRLRLINHGADGVQKFRIDLGVNFTVIAVDYVPVVPYETDVITLAVAQRADVLVTAPSDPTASYWMRAEDVGGVTCGGSDNPLALAAIYNEGADTSLLPTTTAVAYLNTTVCDVVVPFSTPEYSIAPSPASYQQDITITLELNATGSFEWRLNNQTFKADFNEPILYKAAEGNVSFPGAPQWNVYNFDKNNSILFNLTNLTPFIHPFHLHGHNFYVHDIGEGVWNGSLQQPENPMRRDTQIIPALGYAVLQMEADNPGVWPFHCHVAWHLSGGLAINVLTRPDDIPSIPEIEHQTCVDWAYYSANNIVDQIDAGS